VLPPEMAAAANADRFRREIQVAARLQHAHIVPLLTSDVADSLLYYTMPFVGGESLRSRLARERRVPLEEARRIWRDVLEALVYAHAEGIVHRDVKPANILLSANDALVTDFGIARAIEAAGDDASQTASGLAIGTPAYMAPEQITGDKDADHRVDVYAAGLVMYEMLEGRLPFSGDSIRELLWARLSRQPSPITRADCPPKLARLVARCLAREPSARPPTAAAILAELDTIPALPRPRRQRLPRATAYAVAALGVTVAVLGAKALANIRPRDSAGSADAQPAMAVLPLSNFTTDSADVPLTDAMTQDLIDLLSRVGGLRIVASNSVFAFKDQQMTVGQIAESLHVSRVLEGGFQKIGDRVRMQVQIVDPRSGATQWSAQYDRGLDEIFAVEDSIGHAVISTLQTQPARSRPSQRAALVRRHTPTVEAFLWYLRGLRPTLRQAAGRQQAVEYFNRAIAADSAFADAYARLSIAYNDQAGDSIGSEIGTLTRARQAALEAVALDDSLAAAHTALGWSLLRIGTRPDRPTWRDWAAAESELKHALALNPRDVLAVEGLDLVYLYTGRRREQLAIARTALELDPFSYSAIRRLARALAMNDRCDEAIARLRPLQALHAPGETAGVITGECYAAGGKWKEAIAEFRWAHESGARAALAYLAYAQARAGQRDSALKILSDLLAGRKYSFGPFGIATVYAGLGNYDEAFAWLDKAADDGTMRPNIMSPMFDELRRDPRFARIKARIGL
jgi:TolB-like protein/tetratricopeptide (TPR) repeat protein